jgi:hypothetical protein
VSGHVIDSTNRAPIASATLCFLRLPEGRTERLNQPNTRTDGNGQFNLPATYNYHAASVFIPEGWIFELGPTSGSYLLQVEAPNHRKRILNLHSAFKASGLRDRDHGQNVFYYKGTFPIGDIPLDPQD